MSQKQPENPPPAAQGTSSEVIEISLSQIFAFFRKYALTFIVAGLLSGAIGYGISYLFPIEYTSTAKILPEFSLGANPTGLGALASIAGISLGNQSEALRPDLYPSILKSRPFLIEALTTPLPTQKSTTIYLLSYLGDDSTTALSTKQLEQADSILTLTKAQEEVLLNLSERINASNDKLTGILTVQVELPDPILAAACTNLAVNYLKSFVADYRTTKESDKVRFLQKQLSEAKSRYQRAEYALNAYRDRNQNTYSNVARIEEQRLQSEYLQTQTIYNGLTQQLETARLQLQEEAPILKVLEPPMVANKKSKPKRLITAIGFALMGGFITFLAVLFVKEKVHHKLY